jgi:hypothetical protein
MNSVQFWKSSKDYSTISVMRNLSALPLINHPQIEEVCLEDEEEKVTV